MGSATRRAATAFLQDARRGGFDPDAEKSRRSNQAREESGTKRLPLDKPRPPMTFEQRRPKVKDARVKDPSAPRFRRQRDPLNNINDMEDEASLYIAAAASGEG